MGCLGWIVTCVDPKKGTDPVSQNETQREKGGGLGGRAARVAVRGELEVGWGAEGAEVRESGRASWGRA
ncbi:hypothetical protein CRG98_034592 [Punica granatum]|uniref:Uncharacterized protein n=1 Tax=Punica granatum TaxID=22663 RepID=A0A2I0IMW3_PUNGR|nr:hypothetical protein CRG98_034592 [Punica granatum]